MIRHRLSPVVAGLLLGSLLFGPTIGWAGDAGKVRTESFELLNQGVNAYKKGHYDDAIERLTRASNMALNNFRIYFYLGLALNGGREYQRALDALAVALDLDPDHLQANVAVGDAWLKLGDLAEAQAAYTLSLKLRPEYAAALDGLARIQESQSREQEGILTYRRAIASNPGYAPAYSHLGSLFLRQEKYEEAVALLEEAISVRPDFADGMNRLSLAYNRLGLSNQAIATIQRAIELEPFDPGHISTFGWLQLDQNYPDSAAELFTKAIEIDSAHPDARKGQAEIARRDGRYDDAIQFLQVAIDDRRLGALTRLELEKFATEIGEEQVEHLALQQRFESGEATPEDHGALAQIMARRSRWSEAAELQRGAGATAAARERLAFMLFESEQFIEARELYTQLSGEIDEASHFHNEGVCAAAVGDDRGAAAAFRHALERDPELSKAQLFLGNALLRLGQTAPATEAYAAFLAVNQRGEAAERVRRILKQIAPQAEEISK